MNIYISFKIVILQSINKEVHNYIIKKIIYSYINILKNKK